MPPVSSNHAPTRQAPRAQSGAPPAAALSRALAAAAIEVTAVLGGESLAARKLADPDIAAESLRAQIHEILFGTLRHYGEGDAILALLVDRPLDTPVRAILLVALYRLCTDPDAAHTTVDQAVDAAKLTDARRAGGLINAVLRNFLRQRTRILETISDELPVRWAHPEWWLKRLQNAYPETWQNIAEVANHQPPVTLRVNCRQQTATACLARFAQSGIAAAEIESAPHAIRLPQGARVDRLPGYLSGDFSVQDLGAQRAALLLDVKDNQRVLDACAAPGGKSTHLLELADIELTALDLDEHRCVRVVENLNRLRLMSPRVQVVTGDASQPAAWWDRLPYDRILADVPCTASGVVRRHPDAKWLRRDQDISKFATQQAKIIAALWLLLAPGGKLLYATCSLFPEENNLQISAFCAARSDVIVSHQEQWLPNPDHDGFFYALLEKSAH